MQGMQGLRGLRGLGSRGCGGGVIKLVPSLLALLVQKVLSLLALLVQKDSRGCGDGVIDQTGTKFTCFASTKVHILTPDALRARHWYALHLLY